MCSNGNSTFSLHKSEIVENRCGIWIYFETENLDDEVQALMDKGIDFDQMPQDMPWLWREARLKDLDDNQNTLLRRSKQTKSSAENLVRVVAL